MTRDKTCTARVADHTDTVDCGEPVQRANLCTLHLRLETEALYASIERHEAAIELARLRLAELNTESG